MAEKRVLLVEPDPNLSVTVGKYLAKNGYYLSSVADAQAAVSAADKNKPDIVVLELAMAKNNGVAFLQEFRSYTDWIDVPIIVYSRISKEESGLNSGQWRRQGVVDYLYKPTKTLANLLTSINENA